MLGAKSKIILVSVLTSTLSTLAITTLILKLGYASILAGFGLAAVDAKMLGKLKQSQRIVSQIKTRNQNKRVKARSRFLKRTGKKLVVGSAAALSLGTAAVVLTTIGLEVEDYCDYLDDLEQERAILSEESAEFDMQACAEAAKDDMNDLAEHATAEGKQLLLDALGVQ